MSLGKIRLIRSICLIVMFVAVFILFAFQKFTGGTMREILYTVAGIAFAVELICSVFWRCPHCERHLPVRSSIFMSYCPFCGEHLFDE